MKNWIGAASAVALTFPWFFLLLFHVRTSPIDQAVASGLAIVGAAFLLSWGAEVAQLEIPKSLAVAFVAMVAILPEYAVDIYIAGKAGRDPSYVPFAIANMTGANRLIIGVAWATVAFLWWYRSRSQSVRIEKAHGLEFSFLFLVTVYSFVIPLKRTLSLVDGFVLIGFFAVYIWKATKGSVEEPELEGPALLLADLPRPKRRLAILAIFLFSLAAIATAAKPFTEGLIATGKLLHVEEFLLIQILAPIASEAPEFIVAGLLAYRGNPSLGFGALLSSKLEQWTLLVGMVPLVYTVSLVTGNHPVHPLMLDHRQIEETFLTSAQSLFAVALIADFELSLTDAAMLFVLYVTQYFFPTPHARYLYGIIYVGLALAVFLFRRKNRKGMGSRLKSLSDRN